MSEVKSQLRRRLLDLVFLALAGAIGVGAFYGFMMVKNHNTLDQALIQVLQETQKNLQQEAPEVPEP